MDRSKFQTRILKIFLYIFDVALWCIGLLFVSVGTYCRMILDPILRFDQSATTKILTYLPMCMMTFGALVIIVSFISLICITHTKYKGRFVLAFLLAFVFTLQILITIACIWYESAIDKSIVSGFNNSMVNYHMGSASDMQLNTFQFQGCYNRLRQLTRKNKVTIVAVLSMVLVAELVGFCIALSMAILERNAIKVVEKTEEIDLTQEPDEANFLSQIDIPNAPH